MNNFNAKVLIIWLLCSFYSGHEMQAQSFDEYRHRVQSNFKNYRDEQQRAFKEYRDRINAEFAEYMRQAWPKYKSKPAKPVPNSPEPPKPVIKNPDTPPSNDPIPFDDVKPAPKPVVPPQPIVPLPKPEPQPVKPDTPDPRPIKPNKPVFAFTFYGAKCEMPLENKHRFTLTDVTENAVADGWMVLSSDEYLPAVAHCIDYRDKLHLPDWGYVRFVEQMTTAFFTQTQLNEARLMQMYILTQSGYKVRIARTGNNLVLLLPSKENIYQYPYLTVNGDRYYVVNKNARHTSYCIFDKEFPKEQYFSLQMSQKPQLSAKNTTPRTLTSKRFSAASATVESNRNLIDFYNDYPLTDSWAVYVKSSLSEDVKRQLYPALKNAINGKSKSQAANILLNFVQTAFAYKTDEAQFGYERPLFADETLFYTYCDCEDRAILYSILVRDLLGLDAVLLYYPNHLATAVCFDTEVYGDYMTIDGKRYIVCDPTYINADIGQAIPQFKQTPATIIRTNL